MKVPTFLFVLLLAFAVTVQAQTVDPVRVNTPTVFRWLPLTAAQIADSQTTHFRVQIDANPIVTTAQGVPLPTPIPAVEYVYPVPAGQLTLGPHIGRVQTCSATECSPWHEGTVTVRAMMPPTPAGGGFKSASVVVAPADAIQMVYGYMRLRGIHTPVPDSVIAYLAMRYAQKHADQIILHNRLLDLFDTETSQ